MSTMLMRSNALTSHHTSHSPAGAPRQQYLGTLKILLAGGSRLRPKYEIVRTFHVPLRLEGGEELREDLKRRAVGQP